MNPGPLATQRRRAQAVRLNMCASCFVKPRTNKRNPNGVRYMTCNDCLSRKLSEVEKRNSSLRP